MDNIDEMLENLYSKNNTKLTIKELMVLMITDIDIFLLKEEDQETDKNKMFTTEEIRNQLEDSLRKFISMYSGEVSSVIDQVPFYKAIRLYQKTMS